jgi:hypothetical protein
MIFPGMGSAAMPVFCSSSPVKTGNMSVTRHQVPVAPAWAITEHRDCPGAYYIYIYSSPGPPLITARRQSNTTTRDKFTYVCVPLPNNLYYRDIVVWTG